MIKVLHICPALGSGGIEKLILQWNEAAVKNDIIFVFAVYNTGGEAYDYFTEKGYHIYHIPQIKNVGMKKYQDRLVKILKKENIDILHTNSGPLTWVALKAAKKAGIKKRLVHAHTNLYLLGSNKLIGSAILRVSRRLNIKYATDCLACGEEAGEYCFGKGKFTWIKNGIDLTTFVYSEEERKIIRDKHGIPYDANVIGFAGRLAEQKNPLFALDIIKEIQKKQKGVYFLVIGEGYLKDKMEKICKVNSITNVIFAGTTNKMADYYSAMDTLLFPSLYEGLGIVTIEAQATGLPIVSSDSVPSGIEITDLVYWRKLSDSIEEWSKTTMGSISKENRKSYTFEIKEAGYDKDDTVAKMISIYRSMG